MVIPPGRTYRVVSTDLGHLRNVRFIVLGVLELHDDLHAWPKWRGRDAGLFFYRCINVTVTGGGVGVIDGRGFAWWEAAVWKAMTRTKGWMDVRPNVVDVVNSTDFIIERITLRNAPAFHVRTKNSLRQTVRHVTVHVDTHRQAALRRMWGETVPGGLVTAPSAGSLATRAWRWLMNEAAGRSRPPSRLTPAIAIAAAHEAGDIFGDLPWMFPLNTDGIDVEGRDIHIHDCEIDNFDDAVAVKPSHGGPDASPDNPLLAACTENVIVEDIRVVNGVGMSIGSVSPSDEMNCVRNVTFRRVNFTHPFKAIYVKTETSNAHDSPRSSAVIENVLYEHIRVESPRWFPVYVGPQQMLHITDSSGGLCMADPMACVTEPRVRITNLTLRDVVINGGLAPSVLLCDARAPCEGVTLDRVSRTGWPREGHDWLGRKVGGYLCHNVHGMERDSEPPARCISSGANITRT